MQRTQRRREVALSRGARVHDATASTVGGTEDGGRLLAWTQRQLSLDEIPDRPNHLVQAMSSCTGSNACMETSRSSILYVTGEPSWAALSSMHRRWNASMSGSNGNAPVS